VTAQSYSAVTGFFHAPTQAEIDAYDHDVLAAVRTQNMDTLKQYHAAGRPLKCSNKFGESLLHMACRKGMLDVTTFLVKDAQVPFAVCDDYGRTPLHDACWAHTTNFELIDLILSECPDLLYIQDKRGNTPLSYLRKDKWAAWNQYLNSKPAEFFKPRTLQC
jgi:ankyrin repeat protein